MNFIEINVKAILCSKKVDVPLSLIKITRSSNQPASETYGGLGWAEGPQS